jgi:hypothetical protein
VSGRDGDSGPLVVDQSQFSNQWAYLGTFYPTSTGHIIVHVSDRSDDGAGSTVIGADAMLFFPSADVYVAHTFNAPCSIVHA